MIILIENGTIVPESDYKDASSQASDENSTQGSNSKEKNIKGFEGNNSEKLYDLKAVSETLK